MKFVLPLLFMCAALLGHAQPLHEYYFNNTFAGTGGGGTLTEALACSAQPGAFGTDSINTDNGLCSVADVFCFNAGGGFSYPNNSITGSYSINVLFKLNVLSGYSRIIDFSNSSADAGFYLLNNCLNFYPNGNVGTCPYFQPNIYYLFTFVRDGNTNVISVYVNGVLFASYTDTGNIYKPATSSTPIIFFRDDNTVPCEAKAGCVKYASISQQLLTANQVDSIYQDICNISLPPCNAAINYPGNPYSTGLSTPQPVTLTGTASGTFTSTSGLSINSTTGAINPSASTPGTYTVTYAVSDSGVCSNFSTTATVVIQAPVNNTCSANGNVIVFTNYDGGTLNINVDVNIPNLKIGVVSYEPVEINLTGAYAGNVTRVIRAGFPNTNNQHCNPNVPATVINGPVPANYSIYDIPASTLNNPNGYNFGIICA
ncbi:MAG TPA: LamG-like jellyroll fold domain-containing protein, partial [Chitinophagales bacterium]|nr:LamG-like jellyroll fold domain-containing protein [Chitinophagales bacterium]